MSELREITLPRAKMQRFEVGRLVQGLVSPYTSDYVDYLATQFKSDVITPEEFWLIAELAFMDLKSGIDGKTGQMIRHRAADRVPATERFVRIDLKKVIDALFSPEDAATIKQCKEEVLAEAKALQPTFSATLRREQEQMVDAHLNAINSPKAGQPEKPKKKTGKKTRKSAKKKK